MFVCAFEHVCVSCMCVSLCVFISRVCELLCEVVWHGCFSFLCGCVFVVLKVCVLFVNDCVILYGFFLLGFCDCGWLCVMLVNVFVLERCVVCDVLCEMYVFLWLCVLCVVVWLCGCVCAFCGLL